MASQKILIVDDSKTIRMQIKDMLPKGNFEILEAQDGIEALELINQSHPQLVLLDFFMPRMNGWEVVKQLQEKPALQAIPIVMMSGRREDVEQSIPELFQYFEFISKPFEQDVLVKAIRAATLKAKQRVQSTPAAKPADRPAAASAPVPVGGDAIAVLQAKVDRLQQENAALRTEVDGLKKQVGQIIAFIKQKR